MSSGVAESPKDKIEVTPEMIEAGRSRLWGFDPERDSMTEICAEIYRAMETEKRQSATDLGNGSMALGPPPSVASLPEEPTPEMIRAAEAEATAHIQAYYCGEGDAMPGEGEDLARDVLVAALTAYHRKTREAQKPGGERQ